MEMFVLAFLGGIVGAVLMDITEIYAARIGIYSGVNPPLIGRWFLNLLHGQFSHPNIINSRAFLYEKLVGKIFHYLVGGGGVALIYPIFIQITGLHVINNHFLAGLLFGLLTSLLPWFVLLPSFGWGIFGRRGPENSNAILASMLSHLPYGLGVGVIITTGLQIL